MQYLSPERARGLPHDTRKSDVWSLGIAFFEILVGRTPFEHSEGEQFSSKEDLEMYWSRTVRRKGAYLASDILIIYLADERKVGRQLENVCEHGEVVTTDDLAKC